MDTNLKCNVIDNMSVNYDDTDECLTVEIILEESKNIIISCVYRAPDSNIDVFNEILDKIFTNHNNNKVQFACGDFNIDLLNPHNKTNITNFTDTMYSNSLFPIITTTTY